MGIHDGHRDRMKQTFLRGGLEPFAEVNALELLLFFSRSRGDVNPLAHTLIEHFGTLSGVLDASPEDLRNVPGVGENTVVLLKLIPAMGAKYLASRTDSNLIVKNSRTLQTLLAPYFFAARNEMTFLVCLDAKLKLLGVRKISEGSPTATDISIRQILQAALSLNTSVVILAHNHPSGVALPSDEDLSTTRYLANFLKQTGIILYDHAIWADDDMISLRASGYLGPLLA